MKPNQGQAHPIRLFRRAQAAGELSPPRWDRMEVVLKVTERCNINCSYCYFFNGSNTDYARHPALLGETTVDALVRFLRETVRAAGVRWLQIDFHGGEPLLMKKARFEQMCQTLRTGLADVVQLQFAIQTNAMLADAEWAALFLRHQVGVGVSVDGTPQAHDRYRIDHQGRGTYARTVTGMQLLREHGVEVAAICVLDPDADPASVYRHLADELGLRYIHLTFPHYDHDTAPAGLDQAMTRFLGEFFEIWWRAGRVLEIRVFQRFLALLSGGAEYLAEVADVLAANIAFTVASDGSIGPADEVRNSLPQLFASGAHLQDLNFYTFLRLPEIVRYVQARQERHPDCLDCRWSRICDGGDLLGSDIYRYRAASGFGHRSLYCGTIMDLLQRTEARLGETGLAAERMAEVLMVPA